MGKYSRTFWEPVPSLEKLSEVNWGGGGGGVFYKAF